MFGATVNHSGEARRFPPLSVRLRSRPHFFGVCAPKVLFRMLEQKSAKEHSYVVVASIDNLGQCPHRQIVKVLEAVHLLLENGKVRLWSRA